MQLIRQDLTITPRSDQPGCILVDPVTGETFEFGSTEHYLLEKLSTQYTVDQLADDCTRQFEESYSTDDIVEFLEMLGGWGLLQAGEDTETGEPGAEEEPSEEEDAQAGAEQVAEMRQPNRWHLGNPERFYDALNRELYWLRHLIWAVPVVFVIGLIAVFKHWDIFLIDLGAAISRFGLLGRLIFAAFTVNLATQVVKGMIARHYGMATPSLGLILIFGLIPRFNLQIKPGGMPSRRTRMWLNSASTSLRLFLFGLAVIFWAASRTSGSTLPTVALELALLSMISLIFVGNPLWKGDGANFVSAWLEIPQMQERSRRALKGFFIRQPAVIVRHSKHRLALGLFGLASTAFFLAFVSFIVYVIFTRMEGRWQGAGVALFLGLACYVGFMIQRQKKARRKLASVQGQSMQRKDTASNKPSAGPAPRKAPPGPPGRKTPPGPPKKQALPGAATVAPKKATEDRRWGRRIRWSLGIILLICLFLPYRYDTGGTAEIFPIARVSVTVEWDGILEEVFHDGGEWVEAGDRLARLSHHKQLKDLEVTRASIAAKQFEIERYLTTPLPEEIELAEARQKTAELQYKYSLDEMKRIEKVHAQGVVTLQDFEDVKRTADLHRQELAEAEISLKSTISQINPNQIETLRAEVEKMEGEARFYEEQLERTYVTAPIRGQIVTKDLRFLLRSYLDAGVVFADIEDSSSVFVRIAVPESDIGEVKPGAPLSLKLWSYPNEEFVGKVDEINPATEEADYGQIVYVTSYLDNADGRLKSGLTGYGKIEGSETIMLLAFSRALIRFFRIEFWSWLP